MGQFVNLVSITVVSLRVARAGTVLRTLCLLFRCVFTLWLCSQHGRCGHSLLGHGVPFRHFVLRRHLLSRISHTRSVVVDVVSLTLCLTCDCELTAVLFCCRVLQAPILSSCRGFRYLTDKLSTPSCLAFVSISSRWLRSPPPALARYVYVCSINKAALSLFAGFCCVSARSNGCGH